MPPANPFDYLRRLYRVGGKKGPPPRSTTPKRPTLPPKTDLNAPPAAAAPAASPPPSPSPAPSPAPGAPPDLSSLHQQVQQDLAARAFREPSLLRRTADRLGQAGRSGLAWFKRNQLPIVAGVGTGTAGLVGGQVYEHYRDKQPLGQDPVAHMQPGDGPPPSAAAAEPGAASVRHEIPNITGDELQGLLSRGGAHGLFHDIGQAIGGGLGEYSNQGGAPGLALQAWQNRDQLPGLVGGAQSRYRQLQQALGWAKHLKSYWPLYLGGLGLGVGGALGGLGGGAAGVLQGHPFRRMGRGVVRGGLTGLGAAAGATLGAKYGPGGLGARTAIGGLLGAGAGYLGGGALLGDEEEEEPRKQANFGKLLRSAGRGLGKLTFQGAAPAIAAPFAYDMVAPRNPDGLKTDMLGGGAAGMFGAGAARSFSRGNKFLGASLLAGSLGAGAAPIVNRWKQNYPARLYEQLKQQPTGELQSIPPHRVPRTWLPNDEVRPSQNVLAGSYSNEDVLRPSYERLGPGRYEQAVQRAQDWQNRRGERTPQAQQLLERHFPRWSPEDLKTKYPVLFDQNPEGVLSGTEVTKGVTSYGRPGTRIWVSSPYAGEEGYGKEILEPRARPWSRRATLAHELNHALHNGHLGSYADGRGPLPYGKRQGPSEWESGAKHMNYLLSPVEVDARLSAELDAYRQQTGRSVEGPQDLPAFFQRNRQNRTRLANPQIKDDMWRAFDELPPAHREALQHRILETVQSENPWRRELLNQGV